MSREKPNDSIVQQNHINAVMKFLLVRHYQTVRNDWSKVWTIKPLLSPAGRKSLERAPRVGGWGRKWLFLGLAVYQDDLQKAVGA